MYLDLRDLADELEALRAERAIVVAGEEDNFDAERLAALEALEDEFGDSLRTVANNEPTMILESEFVDYAQQLAEDIDAIPAENQWPLYCIDWERAARELAHDYSRVTFNGDDYMIRAY